MKQQLLIALLGSLMTFPSLARDFTYSHEGQTLTYTVTDEASKTCMVAAADDYPTNPIVGQLVIPQTVSDGSSNYQVTAIGEYAFSNNRELTSVELPASIASIGVAAPSVSASA